MTRPLLTIPLLALTLAICLGHQSPGGEAPAATPPEGFKAIFNGHDLTGWEGSPSYWSVEDGCLTGKADGTLTFMLANPVQQGATFIRKLSPAR